MDDAAFSIDLAAAYTVLAVLLACVFFTATNTISARYTVSYTGELKPLAENIGDVLLKSTGAPGDWYMDPSSARNASIVGLSTGDSNVLSTYRMDGLYFFNASGLKKALGFVDHDEDYGLRFEIQSLDGVVSRAYGYPLPPDTKDVSVSRRIAAIMEQDGTCRDAVVTVFIWRKDVGAR
jgi:hypothetical protein